MNITDTKSARLKDYVFLGCLLVMTLLSRLWLLYFRSPDFFYMEETMSQAIFGLMGKHILEGHPMVYMYGQGYMGSVEAIMVAFFYIFNGISILSLQLAVLTFFTLFIIANFFLLKNVFNRDISFVANAFLVVSPPFLTQISLSSWSGYNETLFFGSLTLLGLVHFFKSHNKTVLFITGLAAGVGFWAHNLILMYFFSAAIFMLLRVNSLAAVSLKDVFLLKSHALPKGVKIAGVGVHVFVLLFLLWNTVSFAAGHLQYQIANFNFETMPSPFRVKEIKKIAALLGAEAIILSFFMFGFKKIMYVFKNIAPLLTGFLIGVLPVIYYSIFDDSGYRQIHASNMIFAKELPVMFYKVVWKGLFGGILSAGFNSAQACISLSLFLGIMGFYIFQNRQEIRRLTRLSFGNYSYAIFPLIMTTLVITICLLNNIGTSNKRYLIPFYFTFSIMFGLVINYAKQKLGLIATLIFLAVLANNVYANVHFFNRQALYDRSHYARVQEDIIQTLRAKEIKGGYAVADQAYALSLISKEQLIFGTYRSLNRMPRYNEYADKLNRVAYIFDEENEIRSLFEKALDQNGISYERIKVHDYLIFIIVREMKSEKDFIPAG